MTAEDPLPLVVIFDRRRYAFQKISSVPSKLGWYPIIPSSRSTFHLYTVLPIKKLIPIIIRLLCAKLPLYFTPPTRLIFSAASEERDAAAAAREEERLHSARMTSTSSIANEQRLGG